MKTSEFLHPTIIGGFLLLKSVALECNHKLSSLPLYIDWGKYYIILFLQSNRHYMYTDNTLERTVLYAPTKRLTNVFC